MRDPEEPKIRCHLLALSLLPSAPCLKLRRRSPSPPTIESVLLPVAQSPARPASAHSAANTRANPHRILQAPRAVALWHLASLDAPTVAVVWALAFAWAGGIQLPFWVPLLLALVTWSVYVCDRLADARAALHSACAPLRNAAVHALRERHLFHWRHRRILIPLAVAAVCASAAIVFAFMPPMARERSSVLAAAAFAYFSSVHFTHGERGAIPNLLRRIFTKELLVGLLFTIGCMLPAWPRLHAAPPVHASLWQFWIPGVYFSALAWLNCRSIARWESRQIDRSSPSAEARSVRFPAVASLAFAGVSLAILAGPLNPRAAELVATGALSALLLALLDRFRLRFSALALRAAADLVLLTPLVLFLR